MTKLERLIHSGVVRLVPKSGLPIGQLPNELPDKAQEALKRIEKELQR